MYRIEVSKHYDVSNEEFESALHCARSCIESVLENEHLLVEVINGSITIKSNDDKELMDANLSGMKEKITGCFCEGAGILYPEFEKVVFE